MPVLPKLISRFNAILIKLPAGSFEKIDKRILIFIWKNKGLKLVKTILIKNNTVGLILPDFKLYYSNQYSVLLVKG